MSVLLTTEDGWIISHLEFIKKIYKDIKNKNDKFKLSFYNKLFDINCQYLRDNQFVKAIDGVLDEDDKNKKKKRRKTKLDSDSSILREIEFVKEKFERILGKNVREDFFLTRGNGDNNKPAREGSNDFFEKSFQEFEEFFGSNLKDEIIVERVGGADYVFPGGCEFYSNDVRDIERKMKGRDFDFILMDPPWWNKFVRRKRGKKSEAGYKMMYNDELLNIPMNKLLKSNGVVGVWCSNAQSHYSDIIEKIFPTWGIKPVATWYWVKVTQSGQPICNFRCKSVKQPYELLIFGVKITNDEAKIPDTKILISVPSSVHSHKPPLTKVIEQYLPDNPQCLEIFARYLLPNWTSYGLEVLKFQHQWLFT